MTRDDWFLEVRADTAWMQIEAADLMARRDPDGELLIASRLAMNVLSDLAADKTLAQSLAERGREEVDAALLVLRRMREMGIELERAMAAEADLRFERAAERWDSAA